MWTIIGIEKDSMFPDVARDDQMKQLDFELFDEAVAYAEKEEYKEYEIVLTSRTSKLARRVMGIARYGD